METKCISMAYRSLRFHLTDLFEWIILFNKIVYYSKQKYWFEIRLISFQFNCLLREDKSFKLIVDFM